MAHLTEYQDWQREFTKTAERLSRKHQREAAREARRYDRPWFAFYAVGAGLLSIVLLMIVVRL